jgi:hypothetical protein
MPKDECLKAEWLKAVPDLGSSKSKLPTVCSLHFKRSDYSGKLKKYLKSTAVPSLHLDLGDDDQEKAAKAADEDQKTSRISSVNCPKWECQEIVKTVKSLGSTNLKLRNQIKMLEKRLTASDSESLKKDKMKMYLSDCSMFGPTQVRCLANGSTKGRGWTAEEKTKAMVLKAMCNQKCYDYVRKNLVPLPSTWEINATCESPVMSTEQQTQPLKAMAKQKKKADAVIRPFLTAASTAQAAVANADKQEELVHDHVVAVQEVHHIVMPAGVWSTEPQKFEIIMDSNVF